MSYSGWDLQKAIYTTLNAVSEITDKVSAVCDHVNQNTEFPYIEIGESTSQPWDTQTSYGTEHDFTVDIWSRSKGSSETKELCQLVYSALHHKDLAVENNQLVSLLNTLTDVDIDPDGLTYHGVMKFKALTQSN